MCVVLFEAAKFVVICSRSNRKYTGINGVQWLSAEQQDTYLLCVALADMAAALPEILFPFLLTDRILVLFG